MAIDNYSLSDIAAATGNGGVFGGGNWGGALGGGLIGYLLGASTNGGGLFGGGRNQAATTDEVAAGFNFAGINNKLNELSAGQAGINQNLSNAICQIGYQGLQHAGELGSKIDTCCCNTQLGIQGVKVDMANYASGLQISQMQGTQKVLDKLCEMESSRKDEIIAQQGQRIAALEADARMCGIPRINTNVWGVYAYPSCNPCCNTNM